MLYRREYFQTLYSLYDEDEYEHNDKLVLKKLSSMLVTIATDMEPENFAGMVEILHKWSKG